MMLSFFIPSDTQEQLVCWWSASPTALHTPQKGKTTKHYYTLYIYCLLFLSKGQALTAYSHCGCGHSCSCSCSARLVGWAMVEPVAVETVIAWSSSAVVPVFIVLCAVATEEQTTCISANHVSDDTLHSSVLHKGSLRLHHHSVVIRKRQPFCLNIPVLVTTNTAGEVPMSHQRYLF